MKNMSVEEVHMPIREEILEELKGIVGKENLCVAKSELYLYSMDVSVRFHKIPDVVVRPESTEQVAAIVRLANEYKIPVTPRGAGSGVAGGAVPIKGGIVVDLTRMDKILEIHPSDLYAVVQAGVVHAKLNEELENYGLFFPPDPGSNKMCTVGGVVAVGGSGMHAVKYGGTKDYVLGLTVVLPTGEVLRTGGKTLKKATGYDLTHLFIGSEGTLGIITEVVLKVIPLPKAKAVVSAAFGKLEDAATTVNAVFREHLLPAAIELLDNSAIRAVNKYQSSLKLPDADAILLFEVDGSETEVRIQAEAISALCKRNGAFEVNWSDDPEKRTRLWEGRSIVGAATSRLIEDYARVYEGEDITVPISKVAEAVRGVREISAKYGLPIVTFGHIGDGNLHPAILINKKKPEHWKLLEIVTAEIHELAFSLGGTTTGEHGVGLLRADYMEKENTPLGLELMRKIKRVIDPNQIMNPGKLNLGE
jgi:glycolate oxidase